MSELGKNIRFYRKSLGKTQKQLAEDLNLARSTVTLYELGRSEPDLKTLGKIADILDTTIDELAGRIPKNK